MDKERLMRWQDCLTVPRHVNLFTNHLLLNKQHLRASEFLYYHAPVLILSFLRYADLNQKAGPVHLPR
jgi:hypothetical protein